MDDFCRLYWRLDSTNRTNEKVVALKQYFSDAAPSDAIWAVFFLIGNRIKRPIGTRLARQWASEQANLSPWLFEECYDRVGDLAETISLVLPPANSNQCIPLKTLIEEKLVPLRDLELAEQRQQTVALWSGLDQRHLFVLGKLMMGGFRVGVSKRLVVRALAEHAGLDPATITHRLMGAWEPSEAFFHSLLDPNQQETAVSKPYPFFLANPLKDAPESLGDVSDWIAEWKWDGIRAQLIRREGETFIWSRGEELVTHQFPEVAAAAERLPDGTVLDGEILGWDDAADQPLKFSQLQRRLGRKKPGKKLRADVPVVLLAFDLLEQDREDLRSRPLDERQSRLQQLLADQTPQMNGELPGRCEEAEQTTHHRVAIRMPPAVPTTVPTTGQGSWSSLAASRETSKQRHAEGLMLKGRSSAYQVGRPVGDWWKWKVEPYTIDAVLIYAQRGHGRRASLYTDYTFAVWNDGALVPFGKAYSGLTDAEIRKVDAFVRQNTREKFGPVRSVTPQLVFELAFENIQRSKRHKSGVAVRFPRISRWRHDKQPADADHLATILSLLESQ